MKKTTSLIAGIILVLVGCLFLVNSLGIFDIGIIGFASDFWPAFLILAGISLIFKKKNLAGIFLVIMFVTLIIGAFDGISFNEPEYSFSQERVDINETVDNLEVKLEFGLGNIDVAKNKEGRFALINSNYTSEKARVTYEENNDSGKLKIRRDDDPDFVFAEENWMIFLDNETSKTLELDYGVSEVRLDLRDLNIEELKISCGVSDNTVIFDNNDIDVRFEGGVSDTEFLFPEDLGVRIDTETGLSDFNMEDFKKSGRLYVSNNYDNAEKKAHIRIEAGLSNFVAKFYEEGDEI